MTRERRLISSGSTFEQQIGYSRAVVDGDWVFVSGTTGFDYDTMTLPDGIVAQTDQTFVNIGRALEKAGATFADVVRVNYVVPRADEFEQCGALELGAKAISGLRRDASADGRPGRRAPFRGATAGIH